MTNKEEAKKKKIEDEEERSRKEQSPTSEKGEGQPNGEAGDGGAEGEVNGSAPPPPPPLPQPADGGDHDATVDGVVDKMVDQERQTAGAVDVEGVEVNIEAHVKTSPTSEDEEGGNAANTVTVQQ